MSRGEGMEAPEALDRLCRATCEQGLFESAAVLSWEEGEPSCLAGRVRSDQITRVRRELRRNRVMRRKLEEGDLVRRDGYAMLPVGEKAAFVVWPTFEVASLSGLVLSRLSSLATASFDVWRQHALDRTLRRRLHTAKRQLAKQEQQTEKVMRRAAHDLKAPLSAMKGYVDMMLRGMAGPLTPTMQRYMDRLRQAIERERQLIDVLLHAPPLMEEPPDLKQYVIASLERSREAMDAKRLGLELVTPADPCRIRADPCALELLMRRLVRQVVRSAAKGAVIEVEVREEGNGWELSLRTQGGVLDVRGWSVCDGIARRLGGSVDVSWKGGVVLLANLPREPSQPVAPRVQSESVMEHVFH